ncbi:MAG: gephyrin-like molybdotransferase Glp [Pseudomonadota bacterium]
MSAPTLKNDCFALPPGVAWTPVDEALARLRARLHPIVATEQVPLDSALGRILAEPVAAKRAHPPAANTAVDGYGFTHGSLPASGVAQLRLLAGRSAAGAPFDGEVAPGEAVRVLTGALLPAGVDTVVLQEDVEVQNGQIAFEARLKKGANARAGGEDFCAGDVLVPAHTPLAPSHIGLLAASGAGEVTVHQRLRVGVLSTGDELAQPGEAAAPGQVYDANRPMLKAMVARWGMEVVDLGACRDDRDALRATLDEASTRVDAVITSGGASAGEEDHLSALMEAEGQVSTWRIAVKPGRPLMLGTWGRGVPVFGLPGNPVASFVCALIFARPALSLLMGAGWPEPQAVQVPAAFEKSKKAGRREYLRARMTQEGAVEVFASEGSGRVSGLAWADGLVELPDEAMTVTQGQMVRYLPYSAFGL